MASTAIPVNPSRLTRRLSRVAGFLLRYGLVLLILWIGGFKFTLTEAKAIEPLLANSRCSHGS